MLNFDLRPLVPECPVLSLICSTGLFVLSYYCPAVIAGKYVNHASFAIFAVFNISAPLAFGVCHICENEMF